jgi:hypothetical protein
MVSKASLTQKRPQFNSTNHDHEIRLEKFSVIEEVPDEVGPPPLPPRSQLTAALPCAAPQCATWQGLAPHSLCRHLAYRTSSPPTPIPPPPWPPQDNIPAQMYHFKPLAQLETTEAGAIVDVVGVVERVDNWQVRDARAGGRHGACAGAVPAPSTCLAAGAGPAGSRGCWRRACLPLAPPPR